VSSHLYAFVLTSASGNAKGLKFLTNLNICRSTPILTLQVYFDVTRQNASLCRMTEGQRQRY